MQLLVVLLVVRLLKEDVRADAGLFQPAVILHRRRGDIDVHAADRAVFVLDAVNGLDAFQHVLDRIVHRVLAGLQRETLMSHVLERDDFAADFLLRQLLAANVLVLRVIRAIDAAVDAVIRQIQRREQHDALPV